MDLLLDKNYTSPCTPFLRWAGGKKWLLKELHKYLPPTGFNSYHEPFIGGGSVFFYLNKQSAYISDLNKDLIETYISVQQEVDSVIEYLKTFKNTKEDYYHIRNKNFRSTAKRAARFIYLNQTSFNGIYRVNLQGKYNVPYGNRSNMNFEYNNLKRASQALQNTIINHGDFANIINNVREKDLVFLDPPYTVTHNNNGFIQYNKKIFSIEEQYRLSEIIDKIKKIGAYYILTNAAHPKIREIFDKNDSIFELKRASIIGGKNAKRGLYAELIITNGL